MGEIAFYPVLRVIQIGLWLMSSSILVGVLIAPYLKIRFLAEARFSPFSSAFGSMTSSTAVDHRRAPRAACHFLFDLEDFDGRLISSATRFLNLSSTGACMATAVALKPGERFKGQNRSSDDVLRHFTARIIWSKSLANQTLYGIRFESLPS